MTAEGTSDAGARHQRRLAAEGQRKGLGAYYTPPEVVDGLLARTLDPLIAARRTAGPDAIAALRVIDPACGSGNFLVAAGRRLAHALVAGGWSPRRACAAAFGRCVAGIDVDPAAARLCRRALREASEGAIDAAEARRQVRVGDALEPIAGPSGTFDLVIGNPPFLSQLGRATARDGEQGRRARQRFGAAVAAYTDPAALFFLVGVELARPDGGVVALIEPLSFLTARDGAGVRSSLQSAGRLVEVWVAGEAIFDAAVEVCAPIVRVGAGVASGPVVVSAGPAVRPVGSTTIGGAASWAPVLAHLQGLPERTFATAGTVRDLAEASADFRDQYYGLAGHVVDEPEGGRDRPRLVTVGLIDPLHLRWGEVATSLHRATVRHPRVAIDGLSPAMQAWARRRLVPKVLVATQTRALEVVVDDAGDLLPSVPVVTVTAPAADRWRVAAVLSSPPATLVAARRHLGAARNAAALKLSPGQVLDLPLPAGGAAWDEAASALRAASGASGATRRSGLVAAGRAMLDAYGVGGDEELLAWWADRLPAR